MIRALVVATLLASVPGLGACGGDAPACQVNGDCDDGETCSADHACVAGPDAGHVDDHADAALACTPNHDGTVTRDELAIVIPASVNFRTSTETAVDLVGTSDADGRHWDFSGVMSGDHDTPFTTATLDGAWYASAFPDGEFVSPLPGADSDGLVGVHVASADKLELLGAASTAQGFQQTELTYDPAVAELELPLHEGQSWSGQSTVTGQAQGIFSTFVDATEVTVDAHGTLATPYGTFPVLRVRMELTRTIGFLVTTTTSYLFVAECYGTVAVVTSRTNESKTEFTTAAEVKRIAP